MNTNLTVSHSRSLGADDELQRIARAGKQWKKTIGRVEDMEGVFPDFLSLPRFWRYFASVLTSFRASSIRI
jgi:hypothetical protein